MKIDAGVFFQDGSVFVNELHDFGTILVSTGQSVCQQLRLKCCTCSTWDLVAQKRPQTWMGILVRAIPFKKVRGGGAERKF